MNNRYIVLGLTLALFSAAFAGCVGANDEDLDDANNGGDNGGNTGPVDYPAATTKTPLDVEVEVSEVWVQPGDTVQVTATSAASSYEWFLAPRKVDDGGDAHAGHGGHGGGDDGGHDHGDGGIDTGELAAGTRSEPIAFEEEGRYTFHCHPHPWMFLGVTVTEDAETSGVAHVALISEDGDFRFAPDELRVQPGTEVIFWNNDTVMHTATQDGFWKKVDADGDSFEFTPEDVGDWYLTAIARDDATGWGEGQTRLLVDDARPDDSKEYAPMTGQLNAGVPENPENEQATHRIRSDYKVKELTLTFTATSGTPVPPEVTVSIAPQSGEAIATTEQGAEGELVLEDLEAGTYDITVTAEQGVLIDYEVQVSAIYELVPPAKWSGGHDHGDGGDDGHHH